MKLTGRMMEEISGLKRKGLSRRAISKALGFSEVSLGNWLKRGEEEVSLFTQDDEAEEKIFSVYGQLFLEYSKAEAEHISELLSVVKAETYDNWKAATWLLERQYPMDFNPNWALAMKDRELNLLNQSSHVLDLKCLSDEELNTLEELSKKMKIINPEF